jgi:dipeptidyl aminopeptidase/acylaminoacyl peptidase
MARRQFLWTSLLATTVAFAQTSVADSTPAPTGGKIFDAAAAFGARESVSDLSLSPDGHTVAYLAPTTGQGSAVYTLSLDAGAKPKLVASSDGSPDRLGRCYWVSNNRLACTIYGVVKSVSFDILPFSRWIAVDTDGSNMRMLSTRSNIYTRGLQLGGGSIVDWLPDEDGAVLMSRIYLPDDHTGSLMGSAAKGLGVDWVDTRTLATKTVEPPRREAVEYLADGRGTVRIMGIKSTRGAIDGYDSGVINFFYRQNGSRDWEKLSEYNEATDSGFEPYAVDHDLNLAYGFKRQGGRRALYSIALDGTLRETVVYGRPDLDVGALAQFGGDGLVRIGRRNRVVGVTYTADAPKPVFFDPEIEKLLLALAKALPGQPLLTIVDANLDESILIIRAGSDRDPGVYYVFNRKSHELRTFLVVRGQLEGVKLAQMSYISYPAADGTSIPAYLTLPPGQESAKGLPAIVLPHGGPAYRNTWGFDWLAQFYAARGYAVIQPNYRGSVGYGDEWFQENGFRSWRTAIGDILDAGHWLVAQGIADPARIAIVGWSYGGYAALQSAVVEPGFFKAVVAIAPVTDLGALKEEHRTWSDFNEVSAYIGDGPHVREGSPALNADKIRVPVLLFHGALDRNVLIIQSQEMADRLQRAGVAHELVTWDGLDHQLDDSAARAQMLQKSDAFLRQSMSK